MKRIAAAALSLAIVAQPALAGDAVIGNPNLSPPVPAHWQYGFDPSGHTRAAYPGAVSSGAAGMSCDGTTDDGPALSAAIASGYAVHFGSGQVCAIKTFPAVSAPSGRNFYASLIGDGTPELLMSAGISIFGPGTSDANGFLFLTVRGLKLQPASAAVPYAIRVSSTAPDGGAITISDNEIGDTTNAAYFTIGIDLENAGNSRIIRNNFSDGPTNTGAGAAIKVNANAAPACNACGNWIEGNVIRGGWHGIWVAGNGNGTTTFDPEGLHANRNGIGGIGGNPILIDQSAGSYLGSNYQLLQNELGSPSGTAAVLIKTAAQISAIGNYLTGGSGLELDNSTKFAISGNVIDVSGGGTGVLMKGDNFGSLSGNAVADAGVGMDWNNTSTQVVASGNQFDAVATNLANFLNSTTNVIVDPSDATVNMWPSAKIQGVTVGALPACNGTTTKNTWQIVTDANAPTLGAALSGGGSTTVIAICTGTTWVAG